MTVYRELLVNQLKPGEVFVVYTSESVKERVWLNQLKRQVGLGLVVLAVLGVFSIIEPIIQAELSYRLLVLRRSSTGETSKTVEPKKSMFGELLWLDSKNIVSPADWQFGLIVPKIGINVPVIANVSVADEKEYDLALKSGVAHGKGTGFPGSNNTIYIFGHSSGYIWNLNRYSTVFYPLKDLDVNDEIVMIFQNKRYLYKVSEKKIVDPSDIDLLASSDQERLILQTCWPPFTNWKRLVVLAVPV